MSAHIVDGQFQSDKYPTCPPGKVPLSVKDTTAQDLLWEYAQRHRTVDAEFSDDMETALRAAGFDPLVKVEPELRELLAAAPWPAPWVANTFEIDCPCPNGEDCGEYHTCEQVDAPEAYPPGGQCVLQIDVPGMERFAAPTARLIASMRNALPALLDQLDAANARAESVNRGHLHDMLEVNKHCNEIEARAAVAEAEVEALRGTIARISAKASMSCEVPCGDCCGCHEAARVAALEGS